MNRICYELQSYDMWLGLPVRYWCWVYIIKGKRGDQHDDIF